MKDVTQYNRKESDAYRHNIFTNEPGDVLLARQIGAVVVTTNISDFKKIHQVVDFKFRKVM